ncbi:hypothetical protein DL96DRAFT_1454914 [Flagelloscypha sp. PMI_526]|nr:hypothetical protein DL96DRAFT_1454914 [Flagelloscypha sp. PMI_526]
MAAAIAATLPTAAPVAAPAQPVEAQLPAFMAKLVDIEAEIPLTTVQLDGLVVSKILKHTGESSTAVTFGLLLGLDLDGTLHISNSFSLPHHLDDEDKSTKSVARYQASMLRSLKEVHADDNLVGFYQATSAGAFFNQSFIEMQALHQEKLRHGGIVIFHDVAQAARGNATFRAFQLTPAFLSAFKKSNFGQTSLANHRLSFSNILREIPVTIRTSPLLSSFVTNLSRSNPASSASRPEEVVTSTLPTSFTPLDLETSGITKTLEQLIETVDSYKTEEGNQAYLLRQTTRERQKAEAMVAKRKEENVARVAQGLPPLPEEDIARFFKVPPEPSRLESTLLLAQMDGHARSLASVSGGSELAKIYSAKN